MMIEVKYKLKEHPNATLFKFFKTKEQAEMFKSQHSDYVFIGDN